MISGRIDLEKRVVLGEFPPDDKEAIGRALGLMVAMAKDYGKKSLKENHDYTKIVLDLVESGIKKTGKKCNPHQISSIGECVLLAYELSQKYSPIS